MKTRWSALLPVLALILCAGPALSQTLGVNVLSNGNFNNTGGATTPYTQPEMGAGWWTATNGTGVWANNACGDAFWVSDAGGGNQAFWYPAIVGYTWAWNSVAQACGQPGVIPVEMLWYVNPGPYIALGANQVTIRLKVNMDGITSGADILIQAATFTHTDNSNNDYVNSQVDNTTGTGWQQLEYVLPLQAGDTVAGFKLITWDGVNELYTPTALPTNVYAGQTFWMDDLEIIFENVPAGPVCDTAGAGLGTEQGENFDNLLISTLAEAPVLDGVISPGEYATDPIVINNSSMNAAGSNAAGTLDFLDCDSSAVVYMGWDASALHVAARVFDESVEYLTNSPNLNQTDGIQIALDHMDLGAAGAVGTTNGLYIFDLTPGTLANNAVAGFQQHWPTVPNPFVGATVVSGLATGGYVIEASIPWADFSPAITPAAGAPMNYLAILLDYDGGNHEGALINQAGGWGAIGANAGGWRNLTLGGVSGGSSGGDPITPSIPNGFVQAGDRLVLSAPAGNGYQWMLDGEPMVGENGATLIFEAVSVTDEGSYTVAYNDGLGKAVLVSPAYVLDVLPAGALPVASGLGMLAAAAALSIGGLLAMRRKN